MAAWASLAVPIAGIWIWRSSWWPLVLFVIWALGASVFTGAMTGKRWRNRSTHMLQHARSAAIRTLSHHRHDWMNDLQIMYGYLRLNKPDRAAEIVDRIREKMENEGRISQLGHAELSMFLLSFRTISDQMRLEVVVPEGLSLDRLPLDTDKLAGSLIGLIHLFRLRAVSTSHTAQNVLRVSMKQSEGALYVELEYEGEWAARRQIAEEAAALVAGLGQLAEEDSTADAKPGTTGRMLITYPLTA